MTWTKQLQDYHDSIPLLKRLHILCTKLDTNQRVHHQDCNLLWARIGLIRGRDAATFRTVTRQNDPHEFITWLYKQYAFLFTELLINTTQYLTCPGCNKQDTMETKDELGRSIPVNRKLTDSLSEAWSETYIDRTACIQCGFAGKHKMRHELSKKPDVLCLQIKRWQTINALKDMTGIEIPKTLYIGTRLYTLHAIIEHHGPTTDSGHYTAYVQRETFVCMDDETVSQHQPELMNNTEAYLIVYNGSP